ncbi:MAG TPA: hypothetical protein VHO06_12610 [Polyangia bacterium]|nr:hypothetical protein [Polyangia bacterium]
MIEQAIAEAVERALAAAEKRIVDAVVAEMARRWPEPDGWHTRAELAEQLDVSVDTVDRRIAAGDSTIEVQKIGRAVRCRLRPRPTEAEIARLAAEARAG